MTVATGNEQQVVALSGDPDGGDFTLEFDGEGPATVPFDADAATFKAALVGLPNIASSDVAVTGTGPWTVEFEGTYADTDVPLLVADGSGLTGGTSPDVEVSTSTAGNPAVTERAFCAVNDGTGAVRNLEVLVGQRPPAGAVLVDASDYYGVGST